MTSKLMAFRRKKKHNQLSLGLNRVWSWKRKKTLEPSKRQENWTLLSGGQSINTSEGRNKLCTFPLTTQSNSQGHSKSVSLGQ